jgi:hypothetical protein
VKIQGPGASLLTLTGYDTPVFEVNATLPVVISGLTISENGGSDEGAVLNNTTLTISGCTISNIQATTSGGAICNTGTMTVSGCTLANDSAFSGGGGIYNTGTMTVSGCTLSLDQAGFSGGGIYNAGTLTVSNSVFSGNSPDNITGPYIDGGGNTFA